MVGRLCPQSTLLLMSLIMAIGYSEGLKAQNYQPPIGIPAPPFGIDEQAPTQPASWPSAEEINYYYVDNTHVNATDSNNTYGYPDKPRMTIPEITYPAGSYVEIHGGPYDGGGQLIFTAQGVPGNPVWVRGVSESEKGEISGEMIIKGSYVIVENLVFSNDYAVIGIRPHGGAQAHHVSVRNCEMFGTATDVGFRSAIGISGPVANRNHDIVIYNNLIYNRGDYRPTAAGENDYHGVAPSRNVDRVWILNNEIYHMGGDSVQVGVANIPDTERPSYVYVAENNFYSNYENALDIKESNHVFAMNNYFHDFHDAVVVIHNMGNGIWIVNNKVYNAPEGIVTSGSTNTWFIGNVVWNIHTRDLGTWNPESGYSDGTAIHFRAADGGAINNTLFNYDNGIQLTTSGPYTLSNNILAARDQVTGYDLRVANSSVSVQTTTDYNLYESANIDFGVGSGASVTEIQDSYAQELNSPAEGSPQFQSTLPISSAFLKPSINSPAVNTGEAHGIFDTFYSWYGLSIKGDINAIPRPIGGEWDIGAYEHPMDLIFSDGFE